jgi:hypothetical protein
MTVENGRQAYANRGGGRRPSVAALARDKDYAELARRGAMGRGRLKHMARHGDRDAETMLKKLGDPFFDPNAGQEW